MKNKALIIGSGNIGKIHSNSIKRLNKKIEINFIKSRDFKDKKDFYEKKLKLINPDYLILCSPASLHYKHIKLIEKYYTKKRVLIEKPLFSKDEKIKSNYRNQYFVAYNLRFHPILNYIKNYLRGKKIFSVKINCSTHLPQWRKINYKNSVI